MTIALNVCPWCGRTPLHKWELRRDYRAVPIGRAHYHGSEGLVCERCGTRTVLNDSHASNIDDLWNAGEITIPLWIKMPKKHYIEEKTKDRLVILMDNSRPLRIADTFISRMDRVVEIDKRALTLAKERPVVQRLRRQPRYRPTYIIQKYRFTLEFSNWVATVQLKKIEQEYHDKLRFEFALEDSKHYFSPYSDIDRRWKEKPGQRAPLYDYMLQELSK